MKYIISNDGTVNAFVGGKPYTFNKSHHNYGALVAYLENGNVEMCGLFSLAEGPR